LFPGFQPESLFIGGLFSSELKCKARLKNVVFAVGYAMDMSQLIRYGYPDVYDSAVALYGNLSELYFEVVRAVLEAILTILS
jgi:hypothetical protein